MSALVSPQLSPSYKLQSNHLYTTGLQLHDESHLPVLLPPICDLIIELLWEPLITPSYDLVPRRASRHAPPPHSPHTTGCTHADTQFRDDYSPQLRALLLRGWRLRSVHYWANTYANGFYVTYQHPVDASQRWSTEPLWGTHHSPREYEFELEEGERVRQVQVRYDVWYHQVVLETSRGRRCVMGTGESRQYPQGREWEHGLCRTKLLLPEGDGREYEVLAFMYGVGGHVHNMGVYFHEVR